ncbi:MAG: hypothetical protein K0R92_2219 [Lachnospiraceae bacterium]|jgi:hypothetical protein|nr:hypothetical protein [Lachnospiraceae bacterium]
MDVNILSQGVEELQKVKDSLIKLDEYKNENDSLVIEENRLERTIQGKEKAVSDEIASTVRKRKDEIDTTYDEQIGKIQSRSKKIKNKKEKSKSVKITERIEAETADLRDESRQMHLDSKNIFKQDKVPAICNSRLFYALFMPKGLGDLFILFTSLLIFLLAIPCGIYFLLLPQEKVLYLILIYFITVIIFLAIYKVIENKTKDKHREAIRQVRKIRTNLIMNKRKQNIIKKRIRKDTDESVYGLEKFDEELKQTEQELSTLANQKKEALAEFDNTTKTVITEEIKSRYQEELTTIKNDYESVCSKVKLAEENIRTLSLEIASKYEAYLGKEFMVPEKLDELAELMTQNNLATISEAIAEYRGTDE